MPGHPWQEALETIIQTTQAAAVLIGESGLEPWENQEMRACLSELVDRKLPVIPVLLPGTPAEPKLPLFLKNVTSVDLREGLTDPGLEKLVWGITGVKPTKPARREGGVLHPYLTSQAAHLAGYDADSPPHELDFRQVIKLLTHEIDKKTSIMWCEWLAMDTRKEKIRAGISLEGIIISYDYPVIYPDCYGFIEVVNTRPELVQELIGDITNLSEIKPWIPYILWHYDRETIQAWLNQYGITSILLDAWIKYLYPETRGNNTSLESDAVLGAE